MLSTQVALPEAQELDAVLAGGGITSVYQPIIELATGRVVAFEALARGPVDSPLHSPGALFPAAARAGRLTDLDWACRAAALRGALDTALEDGAALFVNLEPVTAAAPVPEQHRETVLAARERLRVVIEFTERALAERPGEVFEAVRELRRIGMEIALDDVGVDPRSLALMPYLRPDVVKLDMSLVQDAPSLAMARTMHAVGAYAEESGAVVLAEGIETPEHLQRALSLGATHGQGWFFGRPAAPPELLGEPGLLPRMQHDALGMVLEGAGGPFSLVQGLGLETRTADKSLLLMLSRQLERHALWLGGECVVVANLQHVRHYSPRTQALYADLAAGAAFVGLLGEEFPHEPGGGVRGGSLEPGEPLADEWTVCVTSPHFAAAMIARDLGDDGDDMARRFEYALTYDRATVVRAARRMMARIAPSA